MTSLELQVGRHVREHRDELARAGVDRAGGGSGGDGGAGGARFLGTEGRATELGETVRLLTYLAQALGVGAVVLFEDYVTWSRERHAAAGEGARALGDRLRVTEEVFAGLLT